MQILVNGNVNNVNDDLTLVQLLDRLDNLPKIFVVELNGQIIYKEQYHSCILKEGDSIEIAAFVGGG